MEISRTPGGGAVPRAAEAAELLASARTMIQQACDLLDGDVADVHPGQAVAEAPGALLDAVATAEQVLSLAEAAQMRASVAFRRERIAEELSAGTPRREAGRGVGHELALARHISPARAGNQLALDSVIVETLPQTMGLLSHGRISKWAAQEVAKAVICLEDEDRAIVDGDLSEHLEEISPRQAGKLARGRADELDQQAALARNEREVADRHVSIRPVSDAMVRISAELPLVAGVSVFKALDDAASSARARGAGGTRGQLMADALIARTTGLEDIADVDVEIQLLMTDEALLADAPDAAWIEGHPVPAAIARRLALAGSADDEGPPDGGAADGGPADGEAADDPPSARPGRSTEQGRRFVRRLFTDPVTGQLRAADAARRRFTGPDRRFVEMADRTCRTPWCDAPIRHIDHVAPHAEGGETVVGNGAGRCESCNYLMQRPGWSARMTGGSPPPSIEPEPSDGPSAGSGPGRDLEVTTPHGRTYSSSPPPIRRVPPPARPADEPPAPAA
jgi:hypothetical protein